MNEMNKLEFYLQNHGYEYKRYFFDSSENPSKVYDVLRVYDDGLFLWNVLYPFEDGYKECLLQGFGVIFDEIEDNLTADEVISRLEAL